MQLSTALKESSLGCVQESYEYWCDILQDKARTIRVRVRVRFRVRVSGGGYFHTRHIGYPRLSLIRPCVL